jgi:hypothetical protein
MKKFLSFNYKNIREFALVVSDAIKTNSVKKKTLFDECSAKYPQIVADIKEYDSPEIYWDNLITLMLVEMGPSDFLELVLDDEQIFKSVMSNIGWRCIGHQEAISYQQSYQNSIHVLENQYGRSKKQLKRRYIELRITYVLKAMGYFNSETVNYNPFEESLSAKYDNILVCLKSLRQYKDSPNSVNIKECNESKENLIDIYKNIFIFLQLFYAGLDKYSSTKQNCISVEKVQERRRECLDAFIDSASRLYGKIKDQTLSEAFHSFCNMCQKYNSRGNDNFNVSQEASRLKYIITRNYICDVTKLEYFSTIKTQDGEETTIFDMLENMSDKYYKDNSFAEWLTYFQDVFFFLIYNEDYDKRGLFKSIGELKDKDCDPIYPYIVSYYRENIDRDNLKKCTYRVPVPVSDVDSENHDQGFVVTLLTEEDYPPNTYFCIPLRYGSTENWWINPFMIPKFVVKRIREINES